MGCFCTVEQCVCLHLVHVVKYGFGVCFAAGIEVQVGTGELRTPGGNAHSKLQNHDAIQDTGTQPSLIDQIPAPFTQITLGTGYRRRLTALHKQHCTQVEYKENQVDQKYIRALQDRPQILTDARPSVPGHQSGFAGEQAPKIL